MHCFRCLQRNPLHCSPAASNQPLRGWWAPAASRTGDVGRLRRPRSLPCASRPPGSPSTASRAQPLTTSLGSSPSKDCASNETRPIPIRGLESPGVQVICPWFNYSVLPAVGTVRKRTFFANCANHRKTTSPSSAADTMTREYLVFAIDQFPRMIVNTGVSCVKD